MKTKLADLINAFASGKIQAKEQAASSPTMTARKLTKADSFVTWQDLSKLMSAQADKISSIKTDTGLLQELLANQELCPDKSTQIKLVINASNAFTPWPNLWTIIPTNKGAKRMKIFACCSVANRLVLKQVQIEGKSICRWNETKNILTH